jgi:bacteriorhodopsin
MLLSASVDLGDPNSVSPGILGFIAFFVLAVALYLLVRNMNAHLRRVRYRQEAEDAHEAAAEQGAAAAPEARDAEKPADASDGTTPAP